MPPHLKKPINQAHLKSGTYEQIVSHLEGQLELNGLEAPDEMQINPVTQKAKKKQILRNPSRHFITAKNGATTETSVVNSRRRETKKTPTKIVPVTTIIVIKTVVKQTLTPTLTRQSVMPMPSVQTTKMMEN